MPSESVYLDGLFRYTSGFRKSFHDAWKARIVMVIHNGLVSGSINLVKMRQWPAPSIIAESSMERGTDRKNCRARKMNSGLPKKDGRISGYQVSMAFAEKKSRWIGMRVTMPGTKIENVKR